MNTTNYERVAQSQIVQSVMYTTDAVLYHTVPK